MKKIILFVSLLSVFLMVMMPNINAVNHQLRENALEEKISTFRNNFKSLMGKDNLDSFSSFYDSISLYLFIGIFWEIIYLLYVLHEGGFTTLQEIIRYFITATPLALAWPLVFIFFNYFCISIYIGYIPYEPLLVLSLLFFADIVLLFTPTLIYKFITLFLHII